MTIDIDTLTEEAFQAFPLVIVGESKEVRYAGQGKVVIRYKPTVYSFTHNRCDVVPGSETIRLQAMRVFLDVLRRAGIRHAYERVNDRWALARLVLPDAVECAKYGVAPFVPPDLSPEEIRALPVAPPIEVIVKAYHEGTSKHRYLGMDGALVRADHPTAAGFRIVAGGAYPAPIVRFDWRNPLEAGGKRVADEALPTDLADYFIDTSQAMRTARHVFAALQEHLGPRDIMGYDLCLFIDTSGTLVYGEITPDCGRFRHFSLGSLDKDVWRSGGSSPDVLRKWLLLAQLAAQPPRPGRITIATADLYRFTGEPMDFTIGTTNPYKVQEIAAIFAPTGARLHPYGADDPEETGATFAENARIKASAYARATGRITIAEDSGLVIAALGGLPGVYSARFVDCSLGTDPWRVLEHVPSGRGRTVIDRLNNERVMDLMRGIEQPRRAARFDVAFAVAAPDGSILFETAGQSHGWIADEPRGTNGFGYDTNFVGEDTDGATYAELDAGRKNLRSHRRQALAELAAWYGRVLARRERVEVTVMGPSRFWRKLLVAQLRDLGYKADDLPHGVSWPEETESQVVFEAAERIDPSMEAFANLGHVLKVLMA